MSLVRIHHIALRVADCERSRHFYADVLGLAERRRQEEAEQIRSIWLTAGDAVVMIERALRGRGDDAGSGHLLCFAVDDLVSWEARLAAHGIAVADRTASTLYISDPDGHRVGLSVYKL
jgi:catechol 2,3-dioxygenase-like lactoylglutathione lyase family enzyme